MVESLSLGMCDKEIVFVKAFPCEDETSCVFRLSFLLGEAIVLYMEGMSL